jgi:hypothetical protein
MTVVIGLLAGFHVASWGAYKDAPFEGFRLRSYLRSIVVAACAALAVGRATGDHQVSPVIALGLIYTAERLATEWWKAILREDDQSAYSIPMRLGLNGRPVDRRSVRYTVGMLVAVAMGALAWAMNTLQHILPGAPPWLVVPIIGGIGGWATAVGGAWKDAPVEGFSGWKFLRSPVVATLWAIPLSLLTANWVILTVAAGGLAVASIETYKTFLTGGRPPGKFATREVRFEPVGLRRTFVAAHAVLWGAFAVTLGVGLAGPLHGLSGHWLRSLDDDLPRTIEAVVATAAAGIAALVVGANVRPNPTAATP